VPGVAHLSVEGVSQRFGSRWVLRELSADFPAGTVQCLLGDNGSGKTTLLRVIGGQLRPTRGRSVLVEGEREQSPTTSLGWVGHELGLYRELLVCEHLELMARLRGVSEGERERTIERLDLRGMVRMPIAALSRGQRQRVALASALMHEPTLYLLDEPLTGLDAGQVRRVEQILGEERDRGAIVVLTVHEPDLIRRLSARGSVLVDGRLAAI